MWLLWLVIAAVIAYLVYALINPEKFQERVKKDVTDRIDIGIILDIGYPGWKIYVSCRCEAENVCGSGV